MIVIGRNEEGCSFDVYAVGHGRMQYLWLQGRMSKNKCLCSWGEIRKDAMLMLLGRNEEGCNVDGMNEDACRVDV